MKKTLAFLLSACMLILCLAAVGCGKGGNGGSATDTAAPAGKDTADGENTAATTDAATDAATDGQTAAPETDATTEAPETDAATESTAPAVPDFPAFDKTKAWDGKNGCLDWYENGDYHGYEIKDAYDLYGLSCLVRAAGENRDLYLDPNNMIILDTDGDGDLSDEAGYDEKHRVHGDNMGSCELILKDDIDLNGQVWLPIGISGYFEGHFSGNGYTVSNFTVNGTTAANMVDGQRTSFYGFFGYVANGAVVEELTVEKATFVVDSLDGKNSYLYLGPFGATMGAVTITNCNAYDITYNIVKLGDPDTLFGYVVSRADSGSTLISGCKVYNFKLE